MFRRNSSRFDHRGGLRRTKSTGSVATNHRGFISLEPQVAHRDAHIAARVSFTKAKQEAERSKPMGIPISSSVYGLARSNSFMNGPDSISFNGDEGEATKQKTDSGLCRQRSVRFTGPAAQKKRDVAIRAKRGSTDHSDLSSRFHLSAVGGHLPKSSPMAGHTYDDFWLDRSVDSESKHDGSACESELLFYQAHRQKLRKSRSMFTGSFMTSESHSDSPAAAISSWSPHGPVKHTSLGTGKHSLRSPKSMSFLRSSSSKGPSMRRQHENSICTSPSKRSLRDSVRLKARPSIFFRSKNNRNASLTEIKTSMRNSSNNSMPIPSTISSTASSFSKGSGLRKAAKKVSKSVKSKFRGIFGRSRKLEESEASNTTASSSVHHSNLSLQEETSVSRVKSYVPSLRSVTSEHCLQARRGSLESIEDGVQKTDGERSRVTSWTNSSTHTVVSSTLDADWEPQRLSVIDEGGHTASTSERWRSSEDEERAYSALVKRLDDMQKQQNRKASLRQGDLADTLDTRSTDSMKVTIGAGPSIEATQNGSDYSYSGIATAHEYDAETVRFSSATNSGIASPAGNLFRTQSPYRKALRTSMRIQERSSSIKPVNLRYLSSLSALSLPTRRSSPEGSEQDVHLSSAESIYSNLSDEEDKNLEMPYDMNEFDTDTLSSPQTQDRAATIAENVKRTHQREVSTASSVEWKTWLSAKVSKLEDCGQSSKVLSEEQTWNPWSVMGHVRENAEIEPDISLSDISDRDNDSSHDVRLEGLEIAAAPVTQSIVIDEGIVHQGHPMLTHDENAPPDHKSKKMTCAENESKIAIRSVSSLPNVKPNDEHETACRKSITPQKQKDSPSTLTESPSRAKKAYFNSGAASSLKSSPGLSWAVRRQFGTVATGSPRRRSIRGGEDMVQSKTLREAASFDDCQFRKGLDAQAMGSKRMVELFLSSRKNKRAPDVDTPDWSAAFV